MTSLPSILAEVVELCNMYLTFVVIEVLFK